MWAVDSLRFRTAVDLRERRLAGPVPDWTIKSMNRCVGEAGGSLLQPTDSQAFRNAVSKLVKTRGSLVAAWRTERASLKYSGQSGDRVIQVPGWRTSVRGGFAQASTTFATNRRMRRRHPVQLRLELLQGHWLTILRSISSTYAGLISMPTHRRSASRAARSVVPEPAYGSSTNPARWLVRARHRRASAVGIMAG